MKPTALITGASSGIGYHIAKWFAKAGYDLIIVARSKDKLLSLQTELQDSNVTVIPHDLSVPNSAYELYQKIRDEGKTVEVLVNNAGFGLSGKFEDTSFETQQKLLHLNMVSLANLTRLFIDDIIHSPFKNVPNGVLNISSMAAFLPGPYMAAYHASKAFVQRYSEALSEELADSGVTVTALCPGPTQTEFFKRAGNDKIMSSFRDAPEDVAKQGFLGFVKGKRVVFPSANIHAAVLLMKLIPSSLLGKITKNMYSR
ncbi:SDR family NAD(P)-dependent oxidoreductase [Terribacillus saccharophilus]|uniref:Short-chain dehydrogenase n=1 Tax=Terribacillus saccharophilus TaxID=361277 RepID=A0A075LM17_9BACI|nr:MULTISPECIES: SDR family oxidoreductase [Terribacillus]AIF65483.1 short-chain dehydrogenase [Terribacillus goriensis]MCM3227092.1 SDR family oxidoreductase [Terribacillus saccharophilus]MEC0284096.1 SDR family oxidoreductase [Terribacillus saccharophilus]MEC0289642.1 SDR family oxidoreductase [Terribacillus saccharophilus]SEN69563.1 hypothetical protein SAMN04489762_2595 [Terribacillus saccharophilus]